jgi:hypothetical protein
MPFSKYIKAMHPLYTKYYRMSNLYFVSVPQTGKRRSFIGCDRVDLVTAYLLHLNGGI